MALPVSEPFTASNGTVLHTYNALWANRFDSEGLTRSNSINTNRTYANNNAATVIFYVYNETPASADYDVQVEMVRRSATASSTFGIIGRVQSPYTWAGCDYYAFYWDSAGNMTGGTASYVLVESTNNFYNLLDSFSAASAASATIKMEFRGSNIDCYVDGVLRCSATDSTHTAAGRAGIMLSNGGSGTASSTGYHLDNFSWANPPAPSAVKAAQIVWM
jgi:hypothetical protein